MSTLAELQSLVSLARRFGQEPAPVILEQIEVLQREEQRRLHREAQIKQRIAQDLTELFNIKEADRELVQSSPPTTSPESEHASAGPADPGDTVELREAQATPPVAETTAQQVARIIAETGVVAPDPVLAQPQKDLEREIRYLREWVGRIAATGPGGGAGDIINLDAPVGIVTSSSYTVTRRDYYVGVNVNTSTSIVLPGANTKAGRSLIIKDESGRCSVNPITISGTIDNDTSGAILAIDNGALHLIYRQGWRIV